MALWRRRFVDGDIQALLRATPCRTQTSQVTPEIELRIVNTTLHEKPTHGSTRTLVAHLGLYATTVRRVWQRNGLKPHLQATFKLSRDSRSSISSSTSWTCM